MENSSSSFNVSVTDFSAEEDDPRILATSYLMYKIGECILCQVNWFMTIGLGLHDSLTKWDEL